MAAAMLRGVGVVKLLGPTGCCRYNSSWDARRGNALEGPISASVAKSPAPPGWVTTERLGGGSSAAAGNFITGGFSGRYSMPCSRHAMRL